MAKESFIIEAILSAQDRMSGVVSKASGAVSKFGSATASAVGKSTGVVSNATESVGKFSKKTGTAMTGAGAAITTFGVGSLKQFGDFQMSLNKAAVVAGGTSKDINGLADVANKMGAVLPISAKDAADAMIEMAQNGASLDDIKKQFPAIAQASTAAGSDLQATAGVVQQSMNIWGKSLKSPEQAAAILVQTANASNASIEDMQQALATIGPIANQAGMDMGTTAEAVGLLTNTGMSAAQAAVDLRFAILKMLAPTKDGKAEMNKLGLSFVDAQGKMKPFPTILNEVANATAGMSKQQKIAALKTMFGTAGMQAMLPLLDSVKDKSGKVTTSWSAYAAEQQKAAGSTEAAQKTLKAQAEDMQKNVGSKIEQVGGNWEALRNKAFSAEQGITTTLLDNTNKMLEWATSSNSSIAQVIRSFVGLSPIIGSVLSSAGMAMIGFGGIVQGLGPIIRGLGTALSFLVTNPIGLTITAISAAILVFMYFYKTNETVRNAVNNAWNNIKTAIGTAIQVVSTVIQTVWGAVSTWFSQNQETIRMVVSTVWNTLKTIIGAAIQGAITVISTIVKNLWEPIATWFSQNQEEIKSAVNGAWSIIKTLVSTTVKAVTSIIGGAWKSTMAWLVENQDLIKGTIDKVWSAIKAFIVPVVRGISKVITTVFGAISKFINKNQDDIKNIIDKVWKVIKTIVNTTIKTIQNILKVVMGVINGNWKAVWEGIKGLAKTVWNGIKSIIKNGISLIKSVIKVGINFIKGIWSTIWNSIKTLTSSIWNGIKGAISSGINAAKNSVRNALAAIKNSFYNAWNSMINWARGIGGRLIGAIKSGLRGMYNIGRDMVSGLWNGIKSGWSWLTGAVGRMARNLVKSVKRKLKIHSPSRVFRDDVGYWITRGIGVGMMNEAGYLDKASSKLVDAATPTIPSIDFGGNWTGVNASVNNQVEHTFSDMDTAKQPAYINVRIGDTEFKRFVDDISKQQGFQGGLAQSFGM